MTKEERQQYNREYREEGFGSSADRRYRLKHLREIRKKDRERKRKALRC